MQTYRYKIVIYCAILLVANNKINAQISIANTDKVATIKNGTTYLAMKDPSAPQAAEYVAAAQKQWTFSTIKCISYKEVEQNITPTASFITIGGSMSDSNSTSANTETRVYLEFWTTNGNFNYDPKKRRHFDQVDKISLATIELFPDHLTQANPSLLYKIEYDANGHLKNWTDGMFGNMLQMLCTSLSKAQNREYKEPFNEQNLVSSLSSTTLYIPKYVLTKFVKNAADESNKQDEKELLRDYPYSYKIVSTEEINTLINDPQADIYYLLLIKSGTNRFVTITNSKTGLIIYSNFSPASQSLKPADLKSLAKSIGKQ
ncbi:hypothetical protein [Flavobacterium sp.]